MDVNLLSAFEDNYIFVIQDQGKALVVDPGDPQVVDDYLKKNNLTLSMILNTHHHWDHTDGVQALLQKYPETEVLTPFFENARYPASSRFVQEADRIDFGPFSFEVIRTPGHTFDHISYYCKEQGALFSGDTVFNIGCGRIFDGSLESLFESLQKIKNLPDATMVYCTHEYTLDNIEFAKSVSDSKALQDYEAGCKESLAKAKRTVPFDLGLNKKLNPFLLAEDIENFSSLRKRKDHF